MRSIQDQKSVLVPSNQLCTCGEHQDRVVPESGLLQSPTDVAHSLIHGGHHASVRLAMRVSDEAVGAQVALGHLQRLVHRLQSHIQEKRLENKESGN